MNNSYLKVDEIQVRAKHAPLMYVIYVCTLTPRSSALRMAVQAPCLQHRAFQPGVITQCSACLSLNRG